MSSTDTTTSANTNSSAASAGDAPVPQPSDPSVGQAAPANPHPEAIAAAKAKVEQDAARAAEKADAEASEVQADAVEAHPVDRLKATIAAHAGALHSIADAAPSVTPSGAESLGTTLKAMAFKFEADMKAFFDHVERRTSPPDNGSGAVQ